MNDHLLAFYHRLPYPARCLAASLRGLRLRRWRYGRESEGWVEEAVERESWSEDRWAGWRAERLARLLDRAATRVPFYRDHWAGRRRRGDRSSPELLENWPLLDKAEVRKQPTAFVADDRDRRKMFAESTSGTTGTPLRLWWSRETVRRWYALVEARLRRWHGVALGDRWAILGGQLVTAADRHRPPFWVWNSPLSQLYLSSYHLTPDNARYYFAAMKEHRVRYLLGYPSAMASLARFALDQDLDAPPLEVALANAEPLFDDQRRVIAAAFGAPARDGYGLAELTVAASECPAGTLHEWPEVGLSEVLGDDDEAVPEGGRGHLITTGLLNPDMPLIRYRTGDRRQTSTESARCPCARALPHFGRVEGRSDDVVLTPDGRRIGRLDPVFKGDLPILEAQIVQERLDRVRLSVVPARGFDHENERDLIERLSGRLGPEVEVIVERVAAIPRGASGKFRAVISELNDDESAPNREAGR